MPQSVEQALTQATLYADSQPYTLIRLPAGGITVAAGIIAEIGEAFCALLVDKDEVTLIIPTEAVNDFSSRLHGHSVSPKNYRLITFDVELDMELVGFMARISQALAEAKVSILPLAAYTRDHILVPAEQFDIAMITLEKLKSDF